MFSQTFTRRVLAAAALSLTAACGGDSKSPTGGNEGPRTPLTADIVGTWRTGNVSAGGFYNPGNGSWDPAGAVGTFFKFTADGRFQQGAYIKSQLYGCVTTVWGYAEGTVEQSGKSLRLHPSYSHLKSTDNCVADWNYEKKNFQVDETLEYERGQDQWGDVGVYLNNPGVQATFFRQSTE
jgi:hypothetical protein